MRDAAMIGRNDLPQLLIDAVLDGELRDPHDLAVAVQDAWVSAEYPTVSVSPGDWFTLFARTGFIEDGRVRLSPRGMPLRYQGEARALYRASTPEGMFGMSWTDDLEVAESFATYRPGRTIWTVEAPPERVLADFSPRGEKEWVIDATGLDVRPLTAVVPR